MEEADKEKALKQVAESNLNEKTLELNVAKRWATIAEKAQEQAEDLQGKLGEAEVKLAKVSSIVFACDKELANLKDTMKNCEHVFYNMGFKDDENSVGAIVFQARKFGFAEGWMAMVNAIGLPDTFPFRDATKFPYLMTCP